MKSISELKRQLNAIEDLEELIPTLKINRNLIKDVIENYKEEYVQEQISTLEATAGILMPLDQANYCINVYKEILGENK